MLYRWPRASPRTAAVPTAKSSCSCAKAAARSNMPIATSPSPLAQACSARASSDAAGVGSLAIVVRLRSGPDQPHLFSMAQLHRFVPVAGAIDGQLADPPIADDTVHQLPAIPLLAIGLPTFL